LVPRGFESLPLRPPCMVWAELPAQTLGSSGLALRPPTVIGDPEKRTELGPTGERRLAAPRPAVLRSRSPHRCVVAFGLAVDG
jgi:hypothetical protein